MHLQKPLVIAGALVAAGLGGLMTTQVASAANNPSGHDGLVDKIASTFNLDKSKVQQVFDEERKAREAQHQQKFEERLRQAVEDGKLSQDVADQLLTKHKELQAYRESIKHKTADERRELMKSKMQELKKWAEENNIARELLGGYGHKMSGPGHADAQ